jgi:hypothetical protein
MLRCLPLIVLLALVPVVASLAAPVPRGAAVEPDISERLVGTWEFSWDGWAGEWTFFDDGTFAGHFEGASGHVGYWTFAEGTLVLWDRRLREDGHAYHAIEYAIHIKPTPRGFTGATPSGTTVAMTAAKGRP